MKLEFSRHIFEKYPNIKFRENPFSGSRIFRCGRTDGRTYMMKLVVAFRKFLRTRLKTWKILKQLDIAFRFICYKAKRSLQTNILHWQARLIAPYVTQQSTLLVFKNSTLVSLGKIYSGVDSKQDGVSVNLCCAPWNTLYALVPQVPIITKQ